MDVAGRPWTLPYFPIQNIRTQLKALAILLFFMAATLTGGVGFLSRGRFVWCMVLMHGVECGSPRTDEVVMPLGDGRARVRGEQAQGRGLGLLVLTGATQGLHARGLAEVDEGAVGEVAGVGREQREGGVDVSVAEQSVGPVEQGDLGGEAVVAAGRRAGAARGDRRWGGFGGGRCERGVSRGGARG